MTSNPYAAPRAHVDDRPATIAGKFLGSGRGVPAVHGWQWITAAFGLFRKQPLAWVLMTLVFLVIAIVVSLVPLAGGFVVQLFSPVFTAGILLGSRRLEEGGEIGVGTLFEGFSSGHAGRLLGFGALGLVATVVIYGVVGVALGLGMWSLLGGGASGAGLGGEAAITLVLGVLVAVALSIPVYMAMWFTPALITLHDMTIGAALRASFFACLRNILPFLLYGVIFLLLMIVAIIPIGLGLLVLLPVLMISIYTSYRDIFFDA